ncbi:MAG: arsenate reductase family protein [Candidatus Obscuribacterales bacterium]
MTERITVYEKPTCSTCRNMDKLLRESGVDYDKINYYVEPVGETKLRELLAKMKLPARDLLRSKDALYKELDLGSGKHTEDQLIKLMVKHPDLMQRPIVECGDKAILGRPIENVEVFLKKKQRS